MSKLLEVNDSSFEKEVLQTEMPVLVEFGASWCGPCKKQLPILNQLAEEYATVLKIVKVDVDDAAEQSKYYGIKSVPTLIFFSKGEEILTLNGLKSLKELQSLLKDKFNL